jgi:hypothetical protein
MTLDPQTIEKGGWVELANGRSVITGTVRSVTATYVTIEGLYPIPLKDWKPTTIKPRPVAN